MIRFIIGIDFGWLDYRVSYHVILQYRHHPRDTTQIFYPHTNFYLLVGIGWYNFHNIIIRYVPGTLYNSVPMYYIGTLYNMYVYLTTFSSSTFYNFNDLPIT